MSTAVDIPMLVVDDQADVRLLIRVVIDTANEGLRVVAEAASGTEALDMADAVDPVVVILDEMMPGMDGVETASLMRSRRPAQIVILCSAYLDERVIERARAAGVVECVAKNNVGDLPDVIRAAVRRLSGPQD